MDSDSSYINFFAFIVAFGIGLILVQSYDPTRYVIKYPTPHNVNKAMYKDDSGTCYKYRMVPRACPNSDRISDIPLQENVPNYQNN